jgi:hypothetical protein
MLVELAFERRSAMKKPHLLEPLAKLYTASATEVIEVEVPALQYLMVDGEGDPNSAPTVRTGAEALFIVADAIKAAVTATGGRAFDGMPLEGLWWVDNPSQFSMEDKSSWKWTLMIAQPDVVTEAMVEQTQDELAPNWAVPSVPPMRLERLYEGRSAQILHLGPLAEEGPTVEKVQRFIQERGGQPRGKHHEIYLKDVFHYPPRELATIIRQPFA